MAFPLSLLTLLSFCGKLHRPPCRSTCQAGFQRSLRLSVDRAATAGAVARHKDTMGVSRNERRKTMSNQPIQAIFQTRHTQVVTFAGTPSKETRETLRKYGYEYRNGNWVRTVPTNDVLTEEEVAKRIAA